jgi:hypothetical protein
MKSNEREINDLFGSLLRPFSENAVRNLSFSGIPVQPLPTEAGSLFAPLPAVAFPEPMVSDERMSTGYFATGEFSSDDFVNRCLFLSSLPEHEEYEEPAVTAINDENVGYTSNIPQKQQIFEDTKPTLEDTSKKTSFLQSSAVTIQEPLHIDTASPPRSKKTGCFCF